MQEVYVIIAYQGEWSDRSEWPVRVVRSAYRAEELICELSAEARQRAIDAEREASAEEGYGFTEEDEEAVYDYPSFTCVKVLMEAA